MLFLYYTMNINNGRQSITSFFLPRYNKIERPMLANSRASKSIKFFVGGLSKFPQLKKSVLRIAMSILLQFYSVDKSYTTYLGMDNFIRWIPGGWTAGWRIALSKLWTTEMKQAINFIPRTATYPLEKSYPLFEQLGLELQSLYKHISLMFWTPAKQLK